MRRPVFVAALAILLSVPAGADDPGTGGAEPGVRFHWAFAARPRSNPSQLVPVTRDGVLESGSKLKLLIQPTVPCFVYVLHRGPNGAVTSLFPGHPDASAAAGDLRYVPPGGRWMTLDDQTGSENFHLLASATRLEELERLLASRAEAGEAAAGDLDRAIVDEVLRLRKNHPLSTAATRPISIGGRLRSAGGEANSWLDQLGRQAVEISAQEFYARTFTIEHR